MRIVMSRIVGLIVSLTMLSALESLRAEQVFLALENTTGSAATGLEVTFSGAEGDLYVDPLAVIAPGCPTPSVPSNGTITDTAVIDWGASCIPPGATVSFIASTDNGPLAVVSGVWIAAGGGDLGAIGSVASDPLPPPDPQNPFAAIKILGYYVPCGSPIYYYWYVASDVYCRYCYIPPAKCYYRVLYCPFANRSQRFKEVPPWIPLTCWERGPDIPARESLRYFVYWLHGQPPAPPPGLPPGSPSDFPWGSWEFNLDVRYSDDSGTTWRKASDFTSTFYEASALLCPPAGQPIPTNLSEMMIEFAPLYLASAATLDSLIAEADDVLAYEPDDTLQAVRDDLSDLRVDLDLLGLQLAGGTATDPTPYLSAASALYDLADQVPLLDGANRFLNAAADFEKMAQRLEVAGQMVIAGLNEELEEVCYRDSMFNDVPTMTEHVATGMFPHIRVQVDLGDYQWYGSTLPGAFVRIQSVASGEILDELVLPLSKANEFDIPLLYFADDELRVEIKLPTHLSKVIEVEVADGALVESVLLTQGDANGDNCVDQADLDMVSADQGQGGIGAPSVPSSDVNGDGYVDALDLDIVVANQGLCGESLPIQDCNANGVADQADLDSGTSADCNGNGAPDECDLADGTSADCNANSVPDECEAAEIVVQEFFNPGSEPFGWWFMGDADHDGDDGLGAARLVHSDVEFVAGVAAYNDIGYVTDAFEVEFDFNITNSAGGVPDGSGFPDPDGLAFIVNCDPLTLGYNGYGLGYKGLPLASFAVEFDTFQNFVGNQPDDPDSNHVGLDVGGSVESMATAFVSPDFDKSGPWHARIRFRNGELAIWTTPPGGVMKEVMSETIPPANIPPVKYFGFGAGTGINSADTDVDNVTITLLDADLDGDGVLDECEGPPSCPGDANGDGANDPLDVGYVLARLGCPVGTGDPLCDAADQNGDGATDPLDAGFVLARLGDECASGGMTITGVFPSFGLEGDLITITGSGFDPDPLNSCVFVGGRAAAASVISASPEMLICQIGPVSATQFGPVELISGIGLPIEPFIIEGDGVTLTSLGGSLLLADSFVSFNANFLANSANSPGTDAATVGADNAVSVTLTGDWQDGDTVIVDLHFQAGVGNWTEAVAQMDVETDPPGDSVPAADCAAALAAVINDVTAGTGIKATSAGGTITVTKPDADGKNTLTGGFGSISR